MKAKTLGWVVHGDAYECAIEPRACPFCLKTDVVVELPEPIRTIQPDGTTHVCHPALGGCNQGFAKTEEAA